MTNSILKEQDGKTIEEIDIPADELAIMSSRVNSIAKHMTYTLQQSARSSIMSSARDFSTAVCDASGDVLALPDGIPVHVTSMSLTTRAIIEYHEDNFTPGDAYLNNSPYHGNTHMADYTIAVPVFYENELMFYCTIRGHQADIGNAVPTTYNWRARNIYEEGALCFPCIKIQNNYQDIDDIIRMIKMRVRVSDVWYGDYLAMIGAARIGERELKSFVDKYGIEKVRTFCKKWQKYGETRMIEEIKKLPSGKWSNESIHDPIPEMVPEGIPVKVKVTVDPDEGNIIVDYSECGDPVAAGLNLCEATVIASGRTGVLNYLGLDIPMCEGALSRIIVKMRENSVVGKATLPYSSSVATTNVADRAVLATQVSLNGLMENRGLAEGALSHPPSISVISGYDSRFQRNFVTQLFTGHTGGMGVNGHDGYINYNISTGGMMEWNSIEKLEQKYPVHYVKQEIVKDSSGAGEWDGAPATEVIITPLEDEVSFAYLCDGKLNTPRGVEGGCNGSEARSAVYKLEAGKASAHELPMFHQVDLEPDEAIISVISSGAGYGNPLERDPEKVKHRVIEGWTSVEKAKSTYGVMLTFDDNNQISVDYESTKYQREQLKKEGERS